MPLQSSAITGRRYRTPYVSRINAQLPYLYPQIQAQKADQRTEAMLGLEREGLALEKERLGEEKALWGAQKENWDKTYNLQQDAASEDERRNRLAMLLGVGNLGAQYYLGHKRNQAIEQMLNAPEAAKATVTPALTNVAEPAKAITPNTPGILAPEQIPSGSGITIAPPVNEATSFFSKEGLTNIPKWKDAATSGSAWLGGLTGTVAANVVKPKQKWKKAAVGAGVGGVTSYLASGGLKKIISGAGSGGDPYEAAIGAVLGGTGGLFF